MIAGALAVDAIFGVGNGRVGAGTPIPDVSVATFAALPATRPDGYLVAVTGETGLSNVIVRWSTGGSTWAFQTVTVTGADVAAVNALLASIRAVSGVTPATSALATIGSDTWLLVYDSTDARWYGVVEDGSELAPYTATGTNEDAYDALGTPYTDAYAILGRGTGSPFSRRGRVIQLTSSGLTVPVWLTPTVHARGAPTQARGMVRMAPSSASTNAVPHANFAESGSVTASSYNTTTSRVNCRDSLLIAGTRASYRYLAFFASRLSLTGIADPTNENYRQLEVRSSAGSGQRLGLRAGYSAALPNTTSWGVYNSAAAFASTGIAWASETRMEVLLDTTTDDCTIWTTGDAAVYTATSIATTASTDFASTVSGISGGARTNTMAFTVALWLAWT